MASVAATEHGRTAVYRYGFRRSPDQDAATPVRHPVVVVGAGPVGLTAAIDLALRGVPVVILDDADRIGEGSRGICWAKRTLEIWDRLGVAAGMVEKGVTWKLGKVFCGDDLVYAFDLLPEDGHKMPAFINLQQYYVEGALVERAAGLDGIDLRWRNKVVGLAPGNDRARLAIETPEGRYHLDADWVIAADGARSALRDLLGLSFRGVTFEDQFLIADVRMAADFPTERRFWFNPTFHSGQSSLMHRQPNNVWRIDLQLDPRADATEEQRPERVIPRLKRVLGDIPFELEWVSLYRFNCRRLDRFVHGRVIFVGDAAHQVSPFGARGANSGVQDAENLAWKLAAVLRGEAAAARCSPCPRTPRGVRAPHGQFGAALGRDRARFAALEPGRVAVRRHRAARRAGSRRTVARSRRRPGVPARAPARHARAALGRRRGAAAAAARRRAHGHR